MRPRNGFASLLIVALLLPLSSYAGEKLHLKSGIIDPLNIVDSQVVDEKTESFFIVQFHAAPTSEDRQSLKRLGFHTWGYVPDDALLVEVPDGVNVSNFKSQNLRSVVPYHWSYRLSPAFTHINVFNAGETVGVTVRLFGQKFRSDILAFFAANGVDLVQDGDKNLIIYTRRGLIQHIAGLAGVEFDEEPAQIQLHYLDVQNSDVKSFVAGDYSDITGYESGTLVMKFDQAWQRGLMGQGQIVAMADTGLDTGEIGQLHQDFKTVMKGYTFGLYSDSWKDSRSRKCD